MAKQAEWHIAVDTGGTFTDCLAIDPEGNLHRSKVLSSGCLKALVLKELSHTKLIIQADWLKLSMFSGFFVQKPGTDFAVKIKNLDATTGMLELEENEQNYSFNAGTNIEITAFEEAPVLATRLVTGTDLGSEFPPLRVRLGSTKGTNALLEGKGTNLALLVTKGFKDLLAIGDQRRPELFALNIQKRQLLYNHVFEVEERLNAAGEVEVELSDKEVQRIVQGVKELKVDTVAIAFMHSYKNPVHEQTVKHALQQANLPYISASAELSPTIKYLYRAETAVVNAYLSPVISNYTKKVRQELSGAELQIMTSAGALVHASFFQPKDSLLSGPAGGVVGAAQIAEQLGEEKVLTLDMGGTSTDVARYDGSFNFQYELQVGEAKLHTKAVAIETVAAGGGSICQTDGVKLSVGPKSAGAYPGPACYGAGGPLTVTDVNLLLGRVYLQKFNIPLYPNKAQEAFHTLKEQLGEESKLEDEVVLAGLLRIANEKMAEAIRRISVRKGYNPKEYALLAFGGAGGQHACAIASLLEINKVIVPYDASLLSALGIQNAAIERTATKQVLQPLKNIKKLKQVVEEVGEEAMQALLLENVEKDVVQLKEKHLFLRFKGQDTPIKIEFTSEEDVEHQFKEKYIQIFGHWLEDRIIELESIKVTAATKLILLEETSKYDEKHQAVATNDHSCFLDDSWQQVPVFDWDKLAPAAQIEGPALLVSQFTSIVLESGWAMRIAANKSAVLIRKPATTIKKANAISEAVALELFTNRFAGVAEEMGSLLERSAFSVNVKERLDFSCAVLDSEGYLVANAPHIPVHLGSLGICTRLVKEHFPLREGDVVITNHPAYGGSHLPDITMISAVYADDGSLLGYVANRAHHAEIGGKRPGSMPPDAKSLEEEGVIILPTYLMRQGKADWNAVEELFRDAKYPSRAVEENLADLKAALAANEAGKKTLQKLAHQYGKETVQHFMAALKKYAHLSLRKTLIRLGYGIYQETEYLDDGSVLKVAITINEKGMKVDFTGSAEVHAGNLNVNPAIVNSIMMYVICLLINEPIPLNEGLLNGVHIILPKGMLNPDFNRPAWDCPAVVGGNTETSQRLVDLILKAFGVVACSQGTMNNLLFGNESFGYYETIGGGSGAGNGFQGADAVHQHMTNTRITDPEILEFRYPVKLEEFSIRKGSGGKGKWFGGNGIYRKILFKEPVKLSVLTQHRKMRPYGMRGGEPGARGEQYVVRVDGTKEWLDPVDGKDISAGDYIVIRTPGGGGYGYSIR